MAVLSPEQYLADLNPAQREAVLTTEGPVLVVAGAGSGKTRVLTYRVAHLVAACGAKPNEILAITFTNKAANEMRTRLEGLLGGIVRAMWVMTFHAACGRILRKEAPRLGLRSTFTIYDQADQVRLVKACLEELEKDPKRFAPSGVHAQISNAKNLLVGPDECYARVASFYDQTVAETYGLYQKRLHAANAVDFDDLLMLTVEVLERFPEARERWAGAFRYLLVDEYQDTNHAQYRLLQLLAAEHRNLCVVGDPDQCLVAGTQITMADGSTRPIEAVRVGDEVLSSFGSGVFRAATVSRVHRSQAAEGIAITTSAGRRIVSTPEHMHFAGFKAGRTPQLFMTYLMWKAGSGFRIGTSRTYTNGQPRSIPGPQVRLNGGRADAAWVVGVHRSEAEARASETLLSLRYCLPTLPFVSTELDTETGGHELLDDEGLSFAHPHFSASTATTNGQRLRRRLNVCLCGDSRGAGPLHRIALFGYDDEGRRAVEALGLSVRPARAGSHGWRYESAHADLERLAEIVQCLEQVLGVSVRYTARLASPAQSGTGGKERNSLPFMPASAVRSGMAMANERGELELVEHVERVALDGAVYDLDVDRTHNYVANGIVTHNSIYAFRGADIRNILEFEHDFPDSRVIALEQNYRSTNRILEAANAVIENNRDRKPKRLWSELGDGDPVRIVEVEDEHAEARLVVTEIARLVEEGLSGAEIAVFYRTNAQSRVLEEILVRNDVAYQVIGGPRFFERAEVKDALAYLQVLVNPADAVSLTRIANRPRRGIGDTSLARLRTAADTQGLTLWEALSRPEEAGLSTAPARAVTSFRNTMESLMAQSGELTVAELLERLLERSGMAEAYEAERTIEAQGRLENLRELVGVAQDYQETADEPTLAGFLQDVSLTSDQDTMRDEGGLVTLMTLHNAKGLEFRAVFITGVEEGVFPHSRSIEEQGLEEERRLFYVGVTRAQEQLTLTHASARSLWGSRGYNLPSRFLDELGAGIERERLHPTSWSDYGHRAAAAAQPRADVPSLSTGDSVRHGSLGEGIVIRIEPDGVVTVRFASDGTERRLMLEYAPLERIG